ncbi:MAG: ShlB/FhaC/HecB family hemolysin secretion/activation protein [Pseudomonadota bacterium]
MRLPRIVHQCLAVVGLVSPLVAWSQASVAPAPGVIPSAQQLEQARDATVRPSSSQVEVPTVPAAPRELGKPSDDITLDVSAYQIEGLSGVPREVLDQLTAPYVGKARSYEQLVDAAAAVSKYMQRELGYYLGYAYLPEQEPKDGVIRIAVMEGRLDEVILNWPPDMLVQREVVERYLARLRQGEILRVRDVERVVFLVNDLQGIRARFEVKAGRVPGTASLVVLPQREARYGGRTEFDANGSRYSGVYRLGALGTVASPLGRGDGLVVNGLAALNGGLTFGLLSYVMPLGSDGLKLGMSVSKVHYQLDKAEFPMDLNGNALAVNAFGLYPFIRSRNLNVFGLLTVERKTFDDRRFEVSDQKSSDDVQVGVVGDFRDNQLSGGVNTYELNWLQGRLGASSVSGTTSTPPHFGKLTLGYSRLQNLVSNRLLMYLRYKGQLGRENLDTTERFSLGGPQGVRGFAPGEATADSGHLLTAELRFLPYESWFGRASHEMAFSAFYDWGRVKLRNDPSAEAVDFVNTLSLSSVGLGAVWDRPKSFGFRVNVAWPVSGEAKNDQVKRVPRTFATLTKYF